MVGKKGTRRHYKHGKQTKEMTIEQLTALMKKIKKERTTKHYLGVDPLRDASMVSVFYWTGLRLSEVVGDRRRTYRVSRFSYAEREALKREGKDWKKEPNPYMLRTSPERPGIRKEDVELDKTEKVLLISALALKHGKREAPLELSLELPYVDLIKRQWERTKPGCKVWDLKREYAWEILKELNPKLYTHYFRFNRTMRFVEDRRISPADLLSWFGWRRVQTAYNYLDLGGRRIKGMSDIMSEKYSGEEEKVDVADEEWGEEVPTKEKEQPVSASRAIKLNSSKEGRLSDEQYEKMLKTPKALTKKNEKLVSSEKTVEAGSTTEVKELTVEEEIAKILNG